MNPNKEVKLVGGCGTIWGKQFHQQNRVYSTKGVSPSMSASAINGLYVRKWQNLDLNKQQTKDISN